MKQKDGRDSEIIKYNVSELSVHTGLENSMLMC